MQKHLTTVVIALAVAGVWGYFADLRQNEIAWFVGRLVFVGGVALGWSVWSQRRAIKSDEKTRS
jgi:hypothetical protein